LAGNWGTCASVFSQKRNICAACFRLQDPALRGIHLQLKRVLICSPLLPCGMRSAVVSVWDSKKGLDTSAAEALIRNFSLYASLRALLHQFCFDGLSETDSKSEGPRSALKVVSPTFKEGHYRQCMRSRPHGAPMWEHWSRNENVWFPQRRRTSRCKSSRL
jgi:hypothetical protein